MSNPVLVEVTRGGRVESRHRGAAVVVDGDGKTVFSVGDVDAAVFPRSAVKAMQGIPLIESGAADAFSFGNRELALACASHSGEAAHVDMAASMLARAGLDGSALECGCHWPSAQAATVALARSGQQPSALHNNCSGKHAGFLCTACHLGIPHEGYVGYEHPIQAAIRDVMSDLTGTHLGTGVCGADGCSIPTYAVPLTGLARGFSRMATGRGLGAERAAAAHRLFTACMAEPFYVAGTGRMCTRLMTVGAGRIFAKTGAEGVYCAALPEQGLAIALKCDDGATRAAEVMVASLLARFIEDDGLKRQLGEIAKISLKNWNGIHVGDAGATPALGD